MRKYYIDNLRVFCILLLFPFHTAMIFNNWGEAFYIHGGDSLPASFFMMCVYPWWMTLLFVIAGMSSYYALSHRSVKEFVKERVNKLLIPLLVGLVTIIPVQTYVADVFHNGYSGNFFEHYAVYFTRFTDLTGYDGGFTLGHLWSGILFLLGLAKSFFNKTNPLMSYLSTAAFPLYYFHQTILVVLGMLVLKYVDEMWIQYVIVCFGTLILSVLCYEICRRNHITAKIFGIKEKKKIT